MNEELKFEVGKTYLVCEGFRIPRTSWSEETNIWNVGDTFVAGAVDGDGDARLNEGSHSILSTLDELQSGKCVLISSEPVMTFIGNLVEEFNKHTHINGEVGPTSCCPIEDDSEVTGGSSPNYYRKSMSLPMTNDRVMFRCVDLEAGDVIDAWDLNFNMGNVVKSSLRGDNKEGVDAKYALDKIIWFALREELRLDLITHKEFWEKAFAVGLAKEI